MRHRQAIGLHNEGKAKAADHGGRAGIGVRLLNRLLSGLQYGQLRVILPSGRVLEHMGSECGPSAIVVIERWRALSRIMTGGDIGFAEAFMDGDWTSPDLTEVIRLAARNNDALTPAIRGSRLFRVFFRLRTMLNANSRRGSRRNIEFHYDLGNDFYRRWLDPSMLYSSAIFDETTGDLEAAQQRKLARITEKLELTPDQSVLEIGCGWGALAVHLAEKSAARVTGITLSPSQLSWAKNTVAKSAVAERIDLRLEDYRDVTGKFDKIVSIEMFEAVGEAYWPAYFKTIADRLKTGGLAVLQVISIEETRYASYRRDTDFIQKYIFPGGFLPSDSALVTAMNAAGLQLKSVEHFGRSYARTLAEWRQRFKAQWPEIAKLGFDQRFHRLWDYYLSYCEAGFEEGAINVGLYTLEHRTGG